MADLIAILEQMRASSGNADTVGLSNDVILDFASRDFPVYGLPPAMIVVILVCILDAGE